MELYNKHYIRTDSKGNIIHGFSDAFEEPKNGDMLINEQGGRQFELISEINPTLMNDDGVYLYKWNGEEAVKA